MAVETWYVEQLLVATNTNRLFISRSESANTAEAATATGWVVAETAAGNYRDMQNGTEISGGFSTTIAPNNTAPTQNAQYTVTGFSPPNLFVSLTAISTVFPYNGYFPAGDWTMNFGFRAVSNGGTQDGRIGVRVFKGDAGFTNVTELTSARLVGTEVTNLATNATQFSVVTWSAPIVQLNRQYLYLKCAWEITGVAGNNNSDVLFRQGSTCSIISPEFKLRNYAIT